MQIKDPAFNYDELKESYSAKRQTDHRIEAYIQNALEDAKTVLNVGAGAGSYEPGDRYVVAVEPSTTMRALRINKNKVPAINAFAEALPFDDKSFDASMAMVTVHHWKDLKKGLNELRRITRKQVIIMTFDPDALDEFWNVDYFPELIEVERQRYPKIDFICSCLDGKCEVLKIPVPFDCTDGFQEAFYGRPEAFLDKDFRLMQSAWGFLEDGVEEVLVKRLEEDLNSGEWDRKYGHHREMPEFVGALRLIISK